jgi:hypothetical protein
MEGFNIRGIVVLEVLASNCLASQLFYKANDSRKLTAICLYMGVRTLSFSFLEFPTVLRLFLVVDAVNIYSNDLSVLCFGRLFDKGEAFCKGLILEVYKHYLFRLGGLVFSGIEAAGWWEGSEWSRQLSCKLNCHSFTSSFSKGRLHD